MVRRETRTLIEGHESTLCLNDGNNSRATYDVVV
jgi:hypothetical protein